MESTTECAACGKEGNSDDMNNCNKCNMVKYCNAACKKKHRTKHKKACERRVAELREEQLFKEVEPEECPLCFLPLPLNASQSTFQSCCGKIICNGCIYAMQMSEGKDLCAFCRTPPAKDNKEQLKRVKKLMDNGNGRAFHQFAGYYAQGINGLAQNYQKVNEFLLKAGELGYAMSYFNLGQAHRDGISVVIDKKKAQYYYELAAMMGSAHARYNLGLLEAQAGNAHRSLKHFVLAAKAGDNASLDLVKEAFVLNQQNARRLTDEGGWITKDIYATTLRAYHQRQKEMTSDMREKAKLLLV